MLRHHLTTTAVGQMLRIEEDIFRQKSRVKMETSFVMHGVTHCPTLNKYFRNEIIFLSEVLT